MWSISLKCLQKFIYRSRICNKYSLIEFLELSCKADRSVYLYQFYLLTYHYLLYSDRKHVCWIFKGNIHFTFPWSWKSGMLLLCGPKASWIDFVQTFTKAELKCTSWLKKCLNQPPFWPKISTLSKYFRVYFVFNWTICPIWGHNLKI